MDRNERAWQLFLVAVQRVNPAPFDITDLAAVKELAAKCLDAVTAFDDQFDDFERRKR